MSARRWMGVMALLLAAAAVQAQAQTQTQTHTHTQAKQAARGWLRFGDGNSLSGELVERADGGGLFRSDRFGTLRFTDAEARFEPLPAAPAVAPVAPAAPPGEALGWRPGDWSIALSGYWRREQGGTTSDLAVDLDSNWLSRHDEIKLSLSANYKVVDRAVDTNDQSGSLRWLHEVASPWVTLGQVRLDRSTFSLDPLPTLDYALVQASVGGGLRWGWADGGRTLVTLNYERLMLELLRLDRRLYARALSVLVENKLHLTPRIDFSNTLVIYRWPDSRTGFDSDAELSYRLSDHLSVGLRYEYRRNAASLATGTYNRVSLTTRLGF